MGKETHAGEDKGEKPNWTDLVAETTYFWVDYPFFLKYFLCLF